MEPSSGARRPLAAIVVVYGQPGAAARAVASLREGTLRPQRIVVVDHSPDSDGAAEIPAGDDLVVSHFPENPGFAAGVNRGARDAPGESDLFLLNPDATVGRGTLDHLARFMTDRPRVAATAPIIDFEPPRERPWFEGGRARLWLGDIRHAPAGVDGECDFVTGGAMWIRREAWEQVGALDPSFFLYCEDVDWCIRARRAGWRIAVAASADPERRARHLVSASVTARGGGDALKTYHIARGTMMLMGRYVPRLMVGPGLLRLLAIGLRVEHGRAWFRGLRGTPPPEEGFR